MLCTAAAGQSKMFTADCLVVTLIEGKIRIYYFRVDATARIC